jgi:hypothetical protein
MSRTIFKSYADARCFPTGTMKGIFHGFMLFIIISPDVSADATRQEQDNIREAVFRYEFKHNGAIGQALKVYCLSHGDNEDDPSDDFIRRFEGHKPRVQKVSKCDADPFKGVVDKETHERGVILRATSIAWISATEVKVTGGYYEDGLSASGNTYTVRKINGKWRVTADRMNWIS